MRHGACHFPQKSKIFLLIFQFAYFIKPVLGFGKQRAQYGILGDNSLELTAFISHSDAVRRYDMKNLTYFINRS